MSAAARTKRPFLISPHYAVAAVDGAHNHFGASAGIVMIHDGKVLLRGHPFQGIRNSWQAEAHAVGAAIVMALDLGVLHLRILIDHYGVACATQGRPVDRSDACQASLEDWILAARGYGMRVTARAVQGHTGTTDLPSRMNHFAHVMADRSRTGSVAIDHPHSDDWLATLGQADKSFAYPTEGEERWNTTMTPGKASHFLGLGRETFETLLSEGHLESVGTGVSTRSVKRLYAVAQEMRHEAYFGFMEREHVPGQWEDEVSRGWDARVSRAWMRSGQGYGPREALPVPTRWSL